jgi:hypothetical protein
VSFAGAQTWSELAGSALALPLVPSLVHPARSATPAKKVSAERREIAEPVFISAAMPECDCRCDGDYKGEMRANPTAVLFSFYPAPAEIPPVY